MAFWDSAWSAITGAFDVKGVGDATANGFATEALNWMDKTVDFIGGVFGAVTKNPFNAGSNMANAYNNIDALDDTAKDFQNISSFSNYIKEQKERGIKIAKERAEMKALNGNSEPASKGILGTMHERLNTPAPTAEPTDYNEIPKLFNLWNNISIR